MKSSEEEVVQSVVKDLEKLGRADIVEIEDADLKSCWYSAPPKDFKPEVCTRPYFHCCQNTLDLIEFVNSYIKQHYMLANKTMWKPIKLITQISAYMAM